MARAKFAKRMAAPEPSRGTENFGCLLLLAAPAGFAIAAWRAGSWIAAALLAALVVPVVAYWAWGRLLLALALLRWRAHDVHGMLVLSDSPLWRPYIERAWLPVLGKKLVTLNWSDRARWSASLEVLLWRHFVGYSSIGGSYRNYCPAVLVLRGLRHPLVFRLHGAFQQAKHGDESQLRLLERGIFQATGVPLESAGG